MNANTNVRKALKAYRQNRRSYNCPSKGWGKAASARAARRLNKALAQNVEG